MTSISDVEKAKELRSIYEQLQQEIGKKIVGQTEIVQQLLISIFCQGHCLLIGVPGLAKTLLIQTLASVLDLSFNRIQFTPDLMPSDILGAETLDQQRNFKFIKGPIFANIILADEINRTPPKTQSALLEAMQEQMVTIAGQRHAVPTPFFVLATQNPIEQEGTYPLPEAQLDRFMFNLILNYPSYEQEIQIVKNTTSTSNHTLKKIINSSQIIDFQELIKKVPIPDNVLEYAVELIHKTRPGTDRASSEANSYLEWGAGPRASQYLILGAKCHALLTGKYTPDIEDVRAIAIPVLRHRLIRNFKAEAEGMTTEKIIKQLF
jgi:MoxR-like ATPase